MPNNEKTLSPPCAMLSPQQRAVVAAATPHGDAPAQNPPHGPHSPKMHPAPARPGRQPRTTAAMRQSPLPSNRPSALHAPIMPIRPALWPRS